MALQSRTGKHFQRHKTQALYGSSHLAEQLDDALVHDLLSQHLAHVELPDELDVAQHAAPRLQVRLHRTGSGTALRDLYWDTHVTHQSRRQDPCSPHLGDANDCNHNNATPLLLHMRHPHSVAFPAHCGNAPRYLKNPPPHPEGLSLRPQSSAS